MTKIELGQEVKDIITGFQGVVTEMSDYLHGCRRVGVQPKTLKKDGGVQESETFDETQLKIVNKKKIIKTEMEKQTIFLGDKVSCPISDFKGIAWGVAVYLNGCRRVAVAPKKDKYNKIQTEWFDEGQLEVQKEKKVKEGQKRTGGPVRKIYNSFNKKASRT